MRAHGAPVECGAGGVHSVSLHVGPGYHRSARCGSPLHRQDTSPKGVTGNVNRASKNSSEVAPGPSAEDARAYATWEQ